MQLKTVKEKIKEDAILISEMMEALAVADGFKDLEAAKSVHENIHVVYERYCNAALRVVRHREAYPIQLSERTDVLERKT